MTVYVHFYRFSEHTINPHTNLYNLASRRPRLLRAWDPVVPYNYCFWSPWLWGYFSSGGNECGGLGIVLFKKAACLEPRSLIHVVYKPCTGSYVFIIPRTNGQGRNVSINSISSTHLPGQQQDGYPCGGQVTAGAHNPERATPILGLCHSPFTYQFIFRHILGHFLQRK